MRHTMSAERPRLAAVRRTARGCRVEDAARFSETRLNEDVPPGRSSSRRAVVAPVAGWLLGAVLLVLLLTAVGCGKKPPEKGKIHVRTKVELVRVVRRTITRTTGQPGFVEAYEQTSLYPKVAGYIDEWKVDIGDTVKKGEEIAHIFVPELEAQHREKQAQVTLDAVRIKVAEQGVTVAEQNWKAAAAQVKETRATAKRYQADVERWQSEVKRLTGLAADRVVDEQVLLESKKQLKSSTASVEAAKATTVAAEATEAARKADYDKSKVDVDAARASALVTKAAEQRLAALVAYTHVRAPYDGVIVNRNVNTDDYVAPGTGDQSGPRSTQGTNMAQRWPLYVVARTDKMRIFLDVPEMEAEGVVKGSPATVRVQAVDDEEVSATVTRTSWSLHLHTRTLRAEIDLPNPDRRHAAGHVRLRLGDGHAEERVGGPDDDGNNDRQSGLLLPVRGRPGRSDVHPVGPQRRQMGRGGEEARERQVGFLHGQGRGRRGGPVGADRRPARPRRQGGEREEVTQGRFFVRWSRLGPRTAARGVTPFVASNHPPHERGKQFPFVPGQARAGIRQARRPFQVSFHLFGPGRAW